jgi:hypothetical protein
MFRKHLAITYFGPSLRCIEDRHDMVDEEFVDRRQNLKERPVQHTQSKQNSQYAYDPGGQADDIPQNRERIINI